MATLVNRSLSMVVCLGYLAGAYLHGRGATVLWVATGLLLPMACIWFPEALGEFTGTMRLQAITAPTPAFLVWAGGWFILVGVPLLVYFFSPAT
ncbi:MAG: hypothetical protein ABI925_04770 [Verrucomicrobiota bacterium]